MILKDTFIDSVSPVSSSTIYRYDIAELITGLSKNQSINQSVNQSINQKLFVTRATSCTELESEVWAVASGRVLRIIKRWDLRHLLKVSNVPYSQTVSGISFHTVGAACRKAPS